MLSSSPIRAIFGARSKFEKAATGIPAGKITQTFVAKYSAATCPPLEYFVVSAALNSVGLHGIATWQTWQEKDFSVTNVRNYIDAVNRRKHKGQF